MTTMIEKSLEFHELMLDGYFYYDYWHWKIKWRLITITDNLYSFYRYYLILWFCLDVFLMLYVIFKE